MEHPESKIRIIGATLDLLSRSGLSGAAINQVVAASAAPRGSIYHFFPGGKLELATVALKEAEQGEGQWFRGIFHRRESIALYEKGNRADLVEQERGEIAVIESFLPKQLSEAETDPHLNAWYDRQGYENADKCAWHFNKVSPFSNGSTWKIQGNWSNAAYNNRTGYYNRGCIDGN